MSGIEEKLCPNCGYAMGKPGPVKARFVGLNGRYERYVYEQYVHDLPGVEAIEHTIICVCCGDVQTWVTDVVEFKVELERKKAAKGRAS